MKTNNNIATISDTELQNITGGNFLNPLEPLGLPVFPPYWLWNLFGKTATDSPVC